ncbi:MAG: hypothetical protein PHX86_08885, partial [Caldisericia bacterium]|nr:hypothetical protein [Caldisericia bacterium]
VLPGVPMLRLFVLFIEFPPKKSIRADARIGAVFVYYILSSSRVGREGAGIYNCEAATKHVA